jgi:hypothetical protein
MQTGEVEANLVRLNEKFKLSYLTDLIASKTAEKIAPKDLDWEFHSGELDRLEQELERAFEQSTLGEERPIDEVNELLIELRLVP